MIIWMPVTMYEGLYEVSSDGQIRNTRTKHILKQYVSSSGYLYVDLYKDKIKKHHMVHRLVAINHIPNPLGLREVNHKDRDKRNNAKYNLEWVSPQQNTEHALSKTYTFISPQGEVIEFFNLRKFCRDNKLDSGCMCRVYKGVNSNHKGWRRYE